MKTENVKPRSLMKREAMQEKSQWRKKLLQDPTPIDGQSPPSSAEGWVPDKPTADATLHVAAVKVIRMSDGSTRKFYLVLVRPAEVQAMKKRVKKLSRRIKKEDTAAERKAAKRAAREFLLSIGKQI